MISGKVQADDKILIERFQNGDSNAFDALVNRHKARAYTYAFRLTRSQDEASDVVAEAFVRVFRALGSFQGNSAFPTWLYRIITNCFLDLRKKQKSRSAASLDDVVHTEDGEMSLQIEAEMPSPHAIAVSKARVSKISEAIEQLPEYQRAIILMYHAEMMSYEDIACALNLPIGTVKSRLNRARLSLRELLEPSVSLFAAA